MLIMMFFSLQHPSLRGNSSVRKSKGGSMILKENDIDRKFWVLMFALLVWMIES